MQGGNAHATSVRSRQVRGEGYTASVFPCRCHRTRWDKAHGPSRRAVRTVTSKAEATGTLRKVVAGSALGRRPNNALQRIAARWRLCLS